MWGACVRDVSHAREGEAHTQGAHTRARSSRTVVERLHVEDDGLGLHDWSGGGGGGEALACLWGCGVVCGCGVWLWCVVGGGSVGLRCVMRGGDGGTSIESNVAPPICSSAMNMAIRGQQISSAGRRWVG